MESDIEQGRALNKEEDKPSASEIKMTKLDTKLKRLPSQSDGSEYCCIYRVSKRVQSVNWQAYDPLLISIGPLHRKDKNLRAMETEKLRYYKTFSERVGMDKE